jgi:hypothetical protein
MDSLLVIVVPVLLCVAAVLVFAVFPEMQNELPGFIRDPLNIVLVFFGLKEKGPEESVTSVTETSVTETQIPTPTATLEVTLDSQLATERDIEKIIPLRRSPAKTWGVTLGRHVFVTKPIEWWPDSAQVAIRNSQNTKWININTYAQNFKRESDSPFPNGVRGTSIAGWIPCRGGEAMNNGGVWIMSVYRLKGSRLVAFVHFEARPNGCPGPTMKSLGVMYSDNDGDTWSRPVQVISDNSWLQDPMWGGVGDGAVLRDYFNKRWIFIFHHGGGLSGAASNDLEGGPGTWKVWDGRGFILPALPSTRSQRRLLPGLNVDGANPHIHWNTFLQQYVLFYHSWANGIYAAVSDDGINWKGLRQVIRPNQYGRPRPWYPTMYSETGGTHFCGENGKLLIANCSEGCSQRESLLIDVTFTRT